MGNGRAGFGTGANFRPGTKVKISPADMAKIEQWAERAESREKLLDILVPYIRGRGFQFLDAWLTQAISAKSDASAPAEEETKAFWVIALLGNLVWAASCFIPGAGILKAPEVIRGALLVKRDSAMTDLGKTFYAAMQVGGSVVAAGTVEQIKKQVAVDHSGAPSGKDVIAEKLNEQRKKLGEVFEKNLAAFGAELVRYEKFQPEAYNRSRETFLKDADRALWASIFPSTDYEDLNTFYKTALESITRALGEFKGQYKTWSEARLRVGMGSPGRYGPELDGGQARRKRIAEFERRHPFKPQLNL